jgi:hypothetical protein
LCFEESKQWQSQEFSKDKDALNDLLNNLNSNQPLFEKVDVEEKIYEVKLFEHGDKIVAYIKDITTIIRL